MDHPARGAGLFPWMYGAIILGGLLGALLVLARRTRAGLIAAATGATLGSVLGLVLCVPALLGGRAASWRWHWSLPLAEGHLALDRLSAVFLLPLLVLGALAAWSGAGSLEHARTRGALRGSDRSVATPILFSNLLLAALATVVLARDGFLFLFAWGLATLLAFLLVSFPDPGEDETRSAAYAAFACSHAASLILLPFILMNERNGSLDLGLAARAFAGRAREHATLLFSLALAGFGTAAGLAPLQAWRARLQAAAPAHASALVSGACPGVALYGLLRALTLLGAPPPLVGEAVLLAGALSALTGVVLGIREADLARLVAHARLGSTGMALIGVGGGLVAQANGAVDAAVLAYAGALLHVIHGAVTAGLLESGAGAVLVATRIRSIAGMGGLLRRMPLAGTALLLGAGATAGLPGLPCFASEWLIAAGLVTGALRGGTGGGAIAAAIPVFALAWGLSATTFARAAGSSLLGPPRTRVAVLSSYPDPGAGEGRRVPAPIRVAIAVLASLVLLLGAVPWLTVRLVVPAAAQISRAPAGASAHLPAEVLAPLPVMSACALLVLALSAGLAWIRGRLLEGRSVEMTATPWASANGATSRIRSAAAPRSLLARPRASWRPGGVSPLEAWPRAMRWLERRPVRLYLAGVLVTATLLLALERLTR